MDAVLLSRIQFALTVGFHFLFPPLSLGMAWLLVIAEWKGWRNNDENWVRVGKFFSKILALTFVVGVATGIVMEFQFGTNWSEYSKFVGDIFGAPLAAEGVLTFFLESGFLGLYLFGRGKVSKGCHWFAILMVAVGATMSAWWILVANSWQQTPAGFAMVNGKPILTSFADAVFTASIFQRFSHVVMAALVAGSFLMAGISAALLRKNGGNTVARNAMKLAIVVGIAASVLVAFPTGDASAKEVAHMQPVKFAAIEGLYVNSESQAPLVLFAIPSTTPPSLHGTIEIRGLLSWLAFGDVNAPVKGLQDVPVADRPPLWMTFVSFHNMVVLGMLFVMTMLWAAWSWRGNTLWNSRKFLMWMIICVPLPVAACQFGWVTAEVGRQPWIVQGLLRTADGVSITVPAYQVLISLILIMGIELLLLWVFFKILFKKVAQGPEHAAA